MIREFRHGLTIRKTGRSARLSAPVSPADIPFVKIAYTGSASVKTGDYVRRGSVIADDCGFLYHASVSGNIKDVSGCDIIIENDRKMISEQYQPFGVRTGKTISGLTLEDALSVIDRAGITEVPSGERTSDLMRRVFGKAKVLAVNAVCSEESEAAAVSIAMKSPEDLVRGCEILMAALGIKQGVIALSSADFEAYGRLRDAVISDGVGELIKCERLSAKYPQSHPSLLVYALTGRELSPLLSPDRAGYAVFSPHSVAAVYEAFATGCPLTDKTVCLSSAPGESAPVSVPVGTPFMSAFAGFCDTHTPVKDGARISGGRVSPAGERFIGSGDCGYSVVSEKAVRFTECNRCGDCISVCPMYLFPFEFIYTGVERAVKNGLPACIECGLCESVCPASFRLLDRVKKLKKEEAEKNCEK